MSRFIQINGQISRLRCASLEMTTKWIPASLEMTTKWIPASLEMTTKWIPARHPTCSTSVENSLQINPFMQNKANFQKSQMNVNLYNTTDYERKSDWTLGENKPNSKPIKANLHFTAENTEYAEKKDIGVSYCSIERYALCPISPCSLRTRRLMKNKAKTKPILSPFGYAQDKLRRMGQFAKSYGPG